MKTSNFMDVVFSLDRSVVVAPKKSGVASASTVPAIPAATAASVSGGTPIDSVAVVSSGDTSQSSSAEAAAGTSHSHPEGFVFFITHLRFLRVRDNFFVFYILIRSPQYISVFTFIADIRFVWL